MKTSIKNLDRFSVAYQFSQTESETTTFATLEAAEKAYDDIACGLLNATNDLEDSHWRNNTNGLSCELRELKEIPIKELEFFNDCESEEEQLEMWDDILFTFSERLKTKCTYLSDSFNVELGEFEVKESEVDGATYLTFFGEKPECILISEIQ